MDRSEGAGGQAQDGAEGPQPSPWGPTLLPAKRETSLLALFERSALGPRVGRRGLRAGGEDILGHVRWDVGDRETLKVKPDLINAAHRGHPTRAASQVAQAGTCRQSSEGCPPGLGRHPGPDTQDRNPQKTWMVCKPPSRRRADKTTFPYLSHKHPAGDLEDILSDGRCPRHAKVFAANRGNTSPR